MSKFDDLLNEMAESGLDDSWIDRLKAASDGSPLRKDLAEAQRRAEEAEAKATRYERGAVLREAGLNLAEEQQAALAAVHKGEWNPDAVKETAVKLGWAQAPEPDPDEQADRAGHQALAAARAGGSAPAAQNTKQALLEQLDPRVLTEEQFFAGLKAAGLTQGS